VLRGGSTYTLCDARRAKGVGILERSKIPTPLARLASQSALWHTQWHRSRGAGCARLATSGFLARTPLPMLPNQLASVAVACDDNCWVIFPVLPVSPGRVCQGEAFGYVPVQQQHLQWGL
jgi:hypothetical protein